MLLQHRFRFSVDIQMDKNLRQALSGWFRWSEHHLVHEKGEGLIPGQGEYGRQLISVSLSHPCFSLSFPLSLKSINIFLGGD